MSTTVDKVDEQISDASKSQQNGHERNRSEELPLEDINDNNNDETIEVEMVVPPDGGWGWVIVAASFMCNLFVDGIIFSFGVFLNDIADAFSVSKASVAFVNSLQSGFYLMAGPFVSALANRYGFRLVTILGSVISCVAFVLAYFSTSIEFLYISYGAIGGIGAGLIYVPAVITTSFYFEKWRALATGIAVCGSGIGAFLLAPLSNILVKTFGWRGALLCQAGMLLHCAVFGAMFRPLKPTRIKVKNTPENAALEVKTTLMEKGVSTTSLHCVQPNRSGFFGTNNNTEYPTAAELLGSSPNIVNTSKSLHSLHKVETETLEKKVSTSEKRLSVPIYPIDDPDLDAMTNEEKIAEENNLLSGDLERLNGKVPTIRRHTISGRRFRTDSECSQKSFRMGKRNSKDPQRPFYRDDIFYGGSLNRLPHYRSQQSSVGYHMSVTRLPTAKDVAEEESGSFYLCPESVRRILTTMLDLSLLKSPSFLILAISGGLTMMGFYTPFLYVTDRAIKANIDPSTAMFLVSVIGIGNTIGRIVCGLVTSSLPGVNALVVNNIFISVGGLVTIFSGLSLSEGYQFFYAASFGLSISVFASLRSILVVDLLGLEKLTNAFGLLLLFQGVAATVGAPLAGAFMDATGSYDASFYLSGSLMLLSAVICYPIKRINMWERRNEKKSDAIEPSAS